MSPLALGLVLAAGPPPTSSPGYDLRWDAPARCPDRQQVMAAVDAMLAAAPPVETPRKVRVELRVLEAEDALTLVADIEIDGTAGRRELSGSRCESLAEAAAVIVAIAINPEAAPPSNADPPRQPAPEPAVVEAPPVDRPTPAATPPPVAAEPVPTAAPEPPRSLARRLHARFEFGVGAGLAALPNPTAVVDAAVGIGGRYWAAMIGAGYWFERVAEIDGAGGVGGRISLWSIGARGCGIPTASERVDFPICAGFDAGAMHGRGHDTVVTRRARSPWVAVGGSAAVAPRLTTRFALYLRVEGFAVLAQPEFNVDGVGKACCDAGGGAKITAGAAFRLP